MYRSAGVLALCVLWSYPAIAGVRLKTRNAVVWGRTQIVVGSVDPTVNHSGTLFLNGVGAPFHVAALSDTFSISFQLAGGVNTIVAQADSEGVSLSSDTLRLTLGYDLRPEVFAYAAVGGGGAILHATVLENPDSAGLAFAWTADARNKVSIAINAPFDSVTSITLPADLPAGEYGFTVTVASTTGDTVRARSIIVRDTAGVRPFDIATDHAGWIDSAVVYGVTPYIFVANGVFANITAKIPDLVRLGVNTIWLQPIYATYRGGQGYDVIDYFRVRSDLGPAADVKTLIASAHAAGLRVLFDFVPNHSSIFHPYAQESAAYGTASHYFDFYQRAADTAPYSQFYQHYEGFINYFWNELPNLNYSNPEVQKWITEAARYWVEKFDIDGYRVDAAWGPAARAPEFFKQWRLVLKRVKPDLLLLAEDKATWPSVFDQRFDASYDWAVEQSWVSHWVWQTTYSTTANPTIFNNTNQNQRAALLRSAMTNAGAGYATRAKVLHFMENNDTFRFLATHDLARTKMVAAMMFSIPGIPLVFNGQEIGASKHPYDTFSIFSSSQKLDAADPYGLFPLYSRLAGMRKKFPSLYGSNFAEMPVTPGGAVYAYRRWEGGQNVLGVINLGSSAVSASISVPVAQMQIDTTRTYFLSDQVSDQVVQVTAAQLAPLVLQMPGYTTRVFVLDSVAVTSVGGQAGTPAEAPAAIALMQNYPNPFNPTTVISWQVPIAANVTLAVYDVLGREVETLVNEVRSPGAYSTPWNAAGLASGIYFYRLEAAGRSFVKRMMFLK
jgi:cyclomaltodextrinase / maltogenic alpha-amylase / neopullulanase